MLGRYVHLVPWSPTCLCEWCVHGISKFVEWDIGCGGAWMGT
jgi:hypothetical protein